MWLTKRFKVKGDARLVELYRLRMFVERGFRAGKLELEINNLRWRGVAKVRMHVAICFVCVYAVAIVAHSIGRPELANCIAPALILIHHHTVFCLSVAQFFSSRVKY